jgi:outer membrane protein assembly factor BamB
MATQVRPLGFNVGGGFEIVFAQNGNLYGASHGNLYSLNPATGAGTLIGLTDFGTTQLNLQAVIAGDGTLYGFHGANMYSIDLSNGALTFIRTTPDPTDLGIFFDGTPVLTPEPATLSLLLMSMFACIGLAVWRRVTSASV